MRTIEPQDVRRLLDSDVLEPTMVLVEGDAHVVPAGHLETDRYRGAMVITTRQDILDQFEGSDISDGDVERLTSTLNVEINTLGG